MDEQRREPADDGDLISIREVCAEMGDISVSTAYSDPEIQALKIPMAHPASG